MEQDESKVRVMSPSESEHYDGVTIEEGGESRSRQSAGDFRYHTGSFGQGFSLRMLSWRELLLGPGGWQRILMLVGAAAVLGFLLFVALPIWLVLRLFLGR